MVKFNFYKKKYDDYIVTLEVKGRWRLRSIRLRNTKRSQNFCLYFIVLVPLKFGHIYFSLTILQLLSDSFMPICQCQQIKEGLCIVRLNENHIFLCGQRILRNYRFRFIFWVSSFQRFLIVFSPSNIQSYAGTVVPCTKNELTHLL